MNEEKEIVIKYRIDRAFETLDEAKLPADKNHWNTVVSRLYYASFYIVNALLFKNNFRTKSHSGVRTLLSKEFVKTSILDKKYGILYGNLFNKRHEGDYEDIVRFSKEEIEPLISKTEDFVETI